MFEVRIIKEDYFLSLSNFEKEIQILLNKGFIIKEFNTYTNDYSVALLIKENNKKVQL